PCQLNLGSAEGAVRGATKQPVYDGTRTRAQPTTRLYFDAHGEAAWRQKDFYSVLNGQGSQAALMARMLELGQSNPPTPNAKLPEDLDIGINRQNQCPTPAEFDDYVRRYAHAGMPFAVTGLDVQEYQTLQRWLGAGAPVEELAPLPTPSEAAQVAQWEALLNAPGAREVLVGRWLFEHLFLAHLYFDGGRSGHFFQLVRSRTPSGQPID
ncbi:fatty acid cis/trans isomerase, partial [Metapseudomonas otitidis]